MHVIGAVPRFLAAAVWVVRMQAFTNMNGVGGFRMSVCRVSRNLVGHRGTSLIRDNPPPHRNPLGS